MLKLEEEIAKSQCPSGAFPSTVRIQNMVYRDENAFVTALSVIEITKLFPNPFLESVCSKAVKFILKCEKPAGSGQFAFYPGDAQPSWLDEYLPADADDTALCQLALFRAGHLNQIQLKSLVADVFEYFRFTNKPPGWPWFREGVFPTWLDHKKMNNPIDICVNINVATLMSVAGCGMSSYQNIVEMAIAALEWAESDIARQKSITPYYPHPAEVSVVFQRAVSAGVKNSAELLDHNNHLWQTNIKKNPHKPLCCAVGEGVVWTSPELQTIRQAVQKLNTPMDLSPSG